jgi:hypothetical protein
MAGPDWDTGGLSLQLGRRESICFALINVLVYTLGLIYNSVISTRLGLIFRALYFFTLERRQTATFYYNIRALNPITPPASVFSIITGQTTILFMPWADITCVYRFQSCHVNLRIHFYYYLLGLQESSFSRHCHKLVICRRDSGIHILHMLRLCPN